MRDGEICSSMASMPRSPASAHCPVIDCAGWLWTLGQPYTENSGISATSNDGQGCTLSTARVMARANTVTIWQRKYDIAIFWQYGDNMAMKTHFLFMTRLLDGDMQLTLISVVPCRLQIAIEKRPKFARITCKNKNIKFQKKKNKIFS